ncbi:MAG TPA: CpsB/CapC family capsule biosynthesis tyrosine phosphatase [Gemmatimonadales bacterium]
MIDLHSHLLPAVDDGSRSAAQSAGVLREMAKAGVTDVCLTPHLRAGEVAAGPPAKHEQAFEELMIAAPPMPRLHRGAEVMLDRPFPKDLGQVRRVTLGGTRFMLVEFPRMVAISSVTNALTRIKEAGLLPIVAHPERYSCCTPSTVQRWRGLGAFMQLDATTLFRSSARGVRVRELLEHGLGDIIAGDNHGDSRSVAAGFKFLVEQDGALQADLLTVKNPGAILKEEPLQPVPPLRIKQSLIQRLRVLLEGEE